MLFYEAKLGLYLYEVLFSTISVTVYTVDISIILIGNGKKNSIKLYSLISTNLNKGVISD